MTITLYDYTAAPSPRRARVYLTEKGIAFETVQVDIGKGEQLGEAYRAINPACTVPALKLEDGTILTDNEGIIAWGEATKPEPNLTGATPVEKALVATAHFNIFAGGFMAIAETLRNSAKGMAGRALPGPDNYEQIPELAERGRTRLGRFFDGMEEKLEGKDFVALDRFTVCDIDLLVAFDFAGWVKAQPGDSHPNLTRWHAGISARPSAKA